MGKGISCAWKMTTIRNLLECESLNYTIFFLLLNIIYLTEARRRITATVEDGVTLMLGNAVDKYDGLFTNIVPKVCM